MPSISKTPHLQLSQWQGNEYVSFLDIAEDNQKIDAKIGQILENMEHKINREDVQGMLGNVDLSGKVDKINGKGLSTNDYINTDKSKVNNLPSNTVQEINNVRSIASAASSGLNNKVDKISGKGLSANDYTTTDKNKVANLPNNTVQEINNLKQSVVDGKTLLATTINDKIGQNVASGSMTHADLSSVIRNNMIYRKQLYNSKTSNLSSLNKILRVFSTNRWTGFTYSESNLHEYGSIANNQIIVKGSWTAQGIVIISNIIDFTKCNEIIVKYELTGNAEGFIELGILSQIPNVKKSGESLIDKPNFLRSVKANNNLSTAILNLDDLVTAGYVGIVCGSEQHEATAKIHEISMLKI